MKWCSAGPDYDHRRDHRRRRPRTGPLGSARCSAGLPSHPRPSGRWSGCSAWTGGRWCRRSPSRRTSRASSVLVLALALALRRWWPAAARGPGRGGAGRRGRTPGAPPSRRSRRRPGRRCGCSPPTCSPAPADAADAGRAGPAAPGGRADPAGVHPGRAGRPGPARPGRRCCRTGSSTRRSAPPAPALYSRFPLTDAGVRRNLRAAASPRRTRRCRCPARRPVRVESAHPLGAVRAGPGAAPGVPTCAPSRRPPRTGRCGSSPATSTPPSTTRRCAACSTPATATPPTPPAQG